MSGYGQSQESSGKFVDIFLISGQICLHKITTFSNFQEMLKQLSYISGIDIKQEMLPFGLNTMGKMGGGGKWTFAVC